MRRWVRWYAIMGSTAALAGYPAKAAEPTVLTPSSKWVVDYAESKCRLLRTFGEGDRRALLFFEQGAPGLRFTLTAAGPDMKPFNAERPIMVRINGSADERKTEPLNGSIETVGPALIYSSLEFGYLVSGEESNEEDDDPTGFPTLDLAQAAKADFIEFGQSGRHVRFATGNMRAPIAALNACSADLVRAWGLDLDRHRSATRMPVWTNRKEITRRIMAHYPSQALARGAQGVLRMRAMLDIEGRVIDCQLERSTKAETLVSSACQEMAQARFEPALDSEGKPMKSYYATTIVYKIAR